MQVFWAAVIFVILGVAHAQPAADGPFSRHHLIDVNITDVGQKRYINDLADIGNMGLDIWLYPTIRKTGRLRVPPESVAMFMDLMADAGISAQIRHTDLQRLNDEVDALPRSPVNYNDFIEGYMRHDAYYTMTQLESYMTNFASIDGVSLSDLSEETYNGNAVKMISITGGTGSNKKTFFIEAGIHSREWISHASMMYFIDRMLSRRLVDTDAGNLFNNFNWYIVPVANPDGYIYTHSSNNNRFWRKNRRVIPGCGSARGVDLNRNFDAMWGGTGSSGTCSSDLYRGPSNFSEAESRNIRNAVHAIKQTSTIDVYLSIHSFSQLLLTPYGYAANTYPPNKDQINEAAEAAQTAILASSGRTYQVGSGADLLYNADGNSGDWARLTEDIDYSITYELRPASGGLNGFILPTSEIAPCSKEVWDSIVAIAETISN